MSDSSVSYTKKEHTGYIKLDSPGTGNVITQQMAQERDTLCAQVNRDSDVYVVVVTGEGGVFSTGGETGFYSASRTIAGINQPVIAAINGDALNEGLELALACDIRLAVENARFGMSQVAQGRLPNDGGTQRLARIVGRSKALEMLFTAETISAMEALEIGLISKVIPGDKLQEEAESLAKAIADKAPLALRYIKESVNQGLDMPLAQGLRLEADLYFLLHTTEDRTEGIRAFLEKRSPHYKGK